MAWELIEQDTIASDCAPPQPPQNGDQSRANLFWWPAIGRVCVVVRRVADDKLELWGRSPGGATEWELLSTTSGAWVGDHDIMAAVDQDGSVVLAVHSAAGGGYRFCKLSASGAVFTWEDPYPSLSGYFLVESGTIPQMVSGTSADPRPRLLGSFWDGVAYGFYSGSFRPSVGGAGFYLHECTVPSERTGWGMALDAARDTIVVFGGEAPGPFKLNDVWEGHGIIGDGFAEVSWSGDGPLARSGPAICHAPELGGVLVYGGEVPDVQFLGRGAWLWDGTSWARTYGTETHVADPVRGGETNNHFFRGRARMAWDGARARPVVFRGLQMSPE
jgi:hypothetical protein